MTDMQTIENAVALEPAKPYPLRVRLRYGYDATIASATSHGIGAMNGTLQSAVDFSREFIGLIPSVLYDQRDRTSALGQTRRIFLFLNNFLIL